MGACVWPDNDRDKVVDYLIMECKVDVDILNGGRLSAKVCYKGQMEIVRRLVEKYCTDVHTKNNHAYTTSIEGNMMR